MFRRRRNYVLPPLGCTAIAAFSAGNFLLEAFLGNKLNQKHLFYNDLLKEVYMFDPPTVDSVSNCIDQVISWASLPTNTGDKMIRLYTHIDRSGYPVKDYVHHLDTLKSYEVARLNPTAFIESHIPSDDSLHLSKVQRTVSSCQQNFV